MLCDVIRFDAMMMIPLLCTYESANTVNRNLSEYVFCVVCMRNYSFHIAHRRWSIHFNDWRHQTHLTIMCHWFFVCLGISFLTLEFVVCATLVKFSFCVLCERDTVLLGPVCLYLVCGWLPYARTELDWQWQKVVDTFACVILFTYAVWIHMCSARVWCVFACVCVVKPSTKFGSYV